jgi:hypothetical protein
MATALYAPNSVNNRRFADGIRGLSMPINGAFREPMDLPVNPVVALNRAIVNIDRQPRAARLGYYSGLGPRLTPVVLKPRLIPRGVEPTPAVNYTEPIDYESPADKVRRVRRELVDAGITSYGLLKGESRVIHRVLHADEHIEAIVYGQHHSSSVMLAATSERIIFLDKKPMALFLDEVSYEVVSGIEFGIHMLFASLTLHTPVKNYDIKYANLRCAQSFAKHIESHRLHRDAPKPAETKQVLKIPNKISDFMACYYLLPTGEDEKQ